MVIISDFSKTFTSADMPTTWSVFAKNGVLGEGYLLDRNTLYNEYFQFEQDGNLEKTEEWFLGHAQLFVKYQLTQKHIDDIVMDDRFFAPRLGVQEFLDYVIEQDIPLIIVTSGITNIISAWFKKRYNYIPEAIFGNEFIMDDGVVVGVEEDSVICPLDKKIEIEFEDNQEEIILLGDNQEDTQIVQGSKIKLGFTDQDRGFDVNIGKEGNMIDVISYL